MKLFRDYLMPWWEVGMLKLYVFVIGLMVGSYWADLVGQYLKVYLVIAIVLGVYFIYKLVTTGFGAVASDSN